MLNNVTNPDTCPRGTAWCTEHELDGDSDQCVSRALDVAPHLCLWLLQDLGDVEPRVVVDGPPTSQALTMLEVVELSDCLHQLRQAALTGNEVEQ